MVIFWDGRSMDQIGIWTSTPWIFSLVIYQLRYQMLGVEPLWLSIPPHLNDLCPQPVSFPWQELSCQFRGVGGGLVSQHKMVCKKKNDRLDLTGIQIRGGGGGSGPLNFLSNALVRLQIELSACCLHDCYNHLGHILI